MTANVHCTHTPTVIRYAISGKTECLVDALYSDILRSDTASVEVVQAKYGDCLIHCNITAEEALYISLKYGVTVTHRINC